VDESTAPPSKRFASFYNNDESDPGVAAMVSRIIVIVIKQVYKKTDYISIIIHLCHNTTAIILTATIFFRDGYRPVGGFITPDTAVVEPGSKVSTFAFI
jgi:hypothetical protein